MNQVRLTCVSNDAAAEVVQEHEDYFGASRYNTVRREGSDVVIDFFDSAWPRDIAEWACEMGYASQEAAETVLWEL